MNAYVLFGYQALSFKGDDAGGPTQTRGLIIGGHVGVNAVDTHDPPTPLLNMCGGGSTHRVWMSDGSQVVADTAALQSPCNLYNLFVNRLIGGSAPVIRDGGATAFSAPIIDPAQLPTVPPLTPGTTPITVNSNTTVTLAPGSYGLVWVKDDGTLNLSAGTYQIGEFTGGKRVRINTVDTTVLLIASEFGVNNDAFIGPACGAQIWVRSDGVGANDFSIHFSKHSEVHGQFYAPNGIISLGDDTDLFGRFIGRDVHSGWNTNVTYCTGTGPPPASNTPAPTATATASATGTASETASATRTSTRTASATPSATASATPTPPPTATATEPPTATATATVTESATLTDTPTATATPTETATATATSTTTQIPSGALLGEVFDDATAQPLGGVLVSAAPGVAANSDASGRYSLPGLSVGDRQLILSKPGYTRSLRSVDVTSNSAARVRDARLTPLGVPQSIGAAGGTLDVPPPSPLLASGESEGGEFPLQVVIAPNTLPDGTDLRLTGLSPQGLIAPPPLGWSVLVGLDLQVDPLPGSAASASVRVPLALLSAAGAPIISALWDEDSGRWVGGPAVSTVGADVAVSGVPLPASGASPISTQLALLVADSIPVAPPAAVAGEALQGVDAALAAADSAAVRAAPPVIVSGTGAGAAVLARIDSPAALPSGTLLEAQLSESYDLRDGSHLLGMRSRQDLAGYQHSASASGALPSPGALGAVFALVPSRSFVFGQLSEGRVRVDVSLPGAGGAPGLIDAAGGVVTGSGGVSLAVPPNAAAGPVVVDVQPVAPGALPGNAGGLADFVGALAIDISSGNLDPTAAYGLGLGTSLADGERFAIARLEVVDQRSVLTFVSLGHSAGGVVVLDACPTGLGACLAGLDGSGSYAVFALAADAALISGTVRDASGPRDGLAVESDSSVLVSVTATGGAYVLPAPAGAPTIFTCRDRANDLIGSATATPVSALPPVVVTDVDITLASTPPQVTQIAPANHASQVDRSAAITVTFSEPIVAATVTDTSVRLLRVNASGQMSVAVRRSLSADGTQLVITPATLLEPDTLYRLELTAAITDRSGTALIPFTSDFTTALAFSAASLPPNTLRVSLPDTDGRVFVCGGAQLAVPGTLVDVINDTTGEVVTVVATDLQGGSGSDVCDTLFPSRCATTEPGSFCGVVSGLIGESIQVQVEDPFGNLITLDAGNMRDERTGATAIGPEGGVVSFPGDERYQAFVPAGAFDEPTIMQLTPIEPDPTIPGMLDLNDPNHPEFAALLNPALDSHIELIGAVQVRLDPPDRVARQNYDVSVPYPNPPADAAQGQYLATRLVNFRGRDELTMVDTAFFDPAGELIITDPGLFEGLTIGGTFGLQRWKECIGFASGWASMGNHANPGASIGGGFLGTVLPFPIDEGTRIHWAVPLPCNQPVQVFLVDANGDVLDTLSCDTCTVGANGVVDLPGALSDQQKFPSVREGDTFVPNGQVAVSPARRIDVSFDESMDPTTLPGNVELRVCGPSEGPGSDPHTQDCRHGPLVAGHPELTPDGRVLVFVPDVRLRYGLRYQLYIHDLMDLNGQPMLRPFYHVFSTNLPRIMGRLPLDARDVTAIDPAIPGIDPDRRFIAVAEGDAYVPDSQGGIRIYDVTDPTTFAQPAAQAFTAGVDRAVISTSDTPLTVVGSNGGTFDGPFVMSVDGPGGPERYGAWRVFQIAASGGALELHQIDSRIINLSAQAMNRLSGVDDVLVPPSGLTGLSELFAFVPNDTGIPADVASLGIQRAFIANTPHIGLQAIDLQGMSTDLDEDQVHGTFRDTTEANVSVPVRTVDTFPDPAHPLVVAVAQEGGANKLVLTDAALQLKDKFQLPGGASPLAVTALTNWPTRIDESGASGTVSHTEPRDLAVVMSGSTMVVVPVDKLGGSFGGDIPDGTGMLQTTADRGRGAAGDPARSLVSLAEGTAGLSIIDLIRPGGQTIDFTDAMLNPFGDGVDDRVLGTIELPHPPLPLPTPIGAGIATSLQVARYDDKDQRPYTAVAAGAAGVYLVSEPLPLEVKKPSFKDCGYAIDGDVIGCEDQTLGQVVGVVGTPYSLHYQSDRTPGGRVIEIPITDATVPPNVAFYDVTVRVAGREFLHRFVPEPNLSTLFAWDGKDANGEISLGAQLATVEVAEIYLAGGTEYRWNVRVWGGTLGGWDTRAHGLGGWSFNVHDFFDPLDRILYLGNGQRRSGGNLGVIQEDGPAHETLIASEDGTHVYVFDSDDGRHLRTIDALSGTTAFTFTYDGQGQLSSITDGSGNSTTVSGGVIAGPFGEQTTATSGADAYWVSIASPTASVGFTYGPFITEFADPDATAPIADGLLLTTTDANGGQWGYQYDGRGRLTHDADTAAGAVSVTRSDLPAGPGVNNAYRIDLDAAGDREFSHEVIELADGSSQLNIDTPDGSTSITIGNDLIEDAVYSTGSSHLERLPGHNFSLSATAESGAISASHKVHRPDPRQLLNVDGFTDQIALEDGTLTSVVAGGTVTTTTAGGQTITTTIDAQRHPTSIQIPGQLLMELTYDHGRLVTLKQDTRQVTFTYTGAFIDSVTDHRGRRVALQRDGSGHITRVTLPDLRHIEFQYDGNGNVVSVTPPSRPAHRFDYNAVDVLTTYHAPDAVTSFGIAPDRSVMTVSRPGFDTRLVQFDAQGRPTLNGPLTYGYDSAGGLAQATSSAPNSVNLAVSHPAPRTTRVEWQGEVSGAVDTEFNARQQVAALTVGVQRITFDPSGDDLLSRAGDLGISRDASGQVSSTSLNQVQDAYTLNRFSEIVNYEASAGAVSLLSTDYIREATPSVTSSPIERDGRIVAIAESRGALTRSLTYAYDPADRLSDVYEDGQPVAHYQYDANGNRQAGTFNRRGALLAVTYDDSDRLLTMSVDESGATVSYAFDYAPDGSLRQVTRDGATSTFAHDLFGNLRTVTLPSGKRIDYLVDATNRRVGKKVSPDGIAPPALVQGLLYADQLRPIAELDGSGSVVAHFVYASQDQVPAYMVRQGRSYRFITDEVGSVRLVVDSVTGAVAQELAYDEFGRVLSDSNPGFQPFGFAGGIYDRDTRLVHFGARDYDPETGRWTTRDPTLFGGLSTNLYAYAGNDPINFVDVGGERLSPSQRNSIIATWSLLGSIVGFLGGGGSGLLAGPGAVVASPAAAMAGTAAGGATGAAIGALLANAIDGGLGGGGGDDGDDLYRSRKRAIKGERGIAARLGRKAREIKDAIHALKRDLKPRAAGRNNPDVWVDPETGNVFVEVFGKPGELIGNLLDYLPK